MESTTGETDRKRRHFSSISPTAATAKKPQFVPLSEDKKLDAAVLQYQNQKLIQKLESQKVEYDYIKQKFSELKKRQESYDITLLVVDESWNKLVDHLQSYSVRIRDTFRGAEDASHKSSTESRSLSPLEDAFLSRLSETGATESSSTNNCHNQTEEAKSTPSEKTKNILRNIVVAIDDLWKLKERLSAALKALPEDGSCSTMVSSDLEAEIKNLRSAFSDIHLKHKLLATDIQKHRDTDAKNKTEFKRLKGELETTVAELEESNIKLAALKSERDATNGAFFPVLNFVNKPLSGDRMGDIQKDLQDMGSALKELLDQASSRALQLQELHEERIKILKQLSMLQNNLKSVKYISSSQSYLSVREQLAKSKAEVANYQAILEKLQVDKDTMAWREKEVNIKNDLADVLSRSSSVAECKMNELRMEIQRQIDQRCSIETKLAEASIEPGRKEIITEFKALVSSFPEDMSSMQHQLSKYKETASDVHSLRADVQSLSSVLDRKAKEIRTLSGRSTNHAAELSRLQNMTQEIKQSDQELRLILEMYRRESIDPRDIMEARDSEYMAWAFVQSMKSSLDEQNLEMRVKTANEAEATAQQRLANAEAEIADLRQKLEPSKRDLSRLSDDLKSKHEENEAYLSEIESIGQAYDDMQTQNQQLLNQIMERDDYNIKLVVEGLKARQLHDALYMGKKITENEINQASASLDIYNMKAARIDDQLNKCSDQVQKLTEDKLQTSFTLENTRKRLLDVIKLAQQTRDSLEESISNLDRNRPGLSEMQIELERERFKRKHVEEQLEGSRRKVSRLKEQMEGTSVIGKLKEEVREYREVLKCSICLDRPKEVVITKCCHLFCNPCVQRIIKSRHRKCPTCATTFGANDIKPVYI